MAQATAIEPPRIQRTFHLSPEDIVRIDELQTREFKRTMKKPEKSDIVAQAIRLLHNQSNG